MADVKTPEIVYSPQMVKSPVEAQPQVTTVILNTNRRADTLACLDSLEAGDYSNHRVIVLDNSSTDGSVDAIREAYPAAQVIRLERNLGYAGNNNIGIDAALETGAQWVFVLNEDTLLAPDCIAQMIAAAESDPKAGVIGPLVYHHDEPQMIQSAGGRVDARWRSQHIAQNEPDDGRFTGSQTVDWVSGCAILVRRGVIEQVGALDERFFYYWEETDWCRRAVDAGWKVLLVPAAKLWHKGVQRDYKPSANVTYYATRNRLLYMRKHGAPVSAWAFVLADNLRTLLSWSLRPRWRGMGEHRAALWQGMGDFARSRWGMRSG